MWPVVLTRDPMKNISDANQWFDITTSLFSEVNLPPSLGEAHQLPAAPKANQIRIITSWAEATDEASSCVCRIDVSIQVRLVSCALSCAFISCCLSSKCLSPSVSHMSGSSPAAQGPSPQLQEVFSLNGTLGHPVDSGRGLLGSRELTGVPTVATAW